MRNAGLLVPVLAFTMATVMATGALVAVFGGFRFGSTSTYYAIFDEISGLTPTSQVRAAGVDIGRVEDTELLPDNTIRVEFAVEHNVPLTTGSTAAIKYQNLVGDRFVELRKGPGGALSAGGTIPNAQTRPALDLDELYNGFTPLFQGLRPAQVNRLSSALVATLQGQGGAVESLLTELGSLTTTLADHSTLISDVVARLNTALETLVRRAPELDATIVNLQRVVSGLANDRHRVGESLDGINDLTTSVSSLLSEQRPDIQGTVEQLGRASRTIMNDHAALDNLRRRLPGYYVPLGRLGATQGALQFYVCGVQLRINTPGEGKIDLPMINSGKVPRC